ncbi:hypothetical protein ACNKHW_06845 [Shigella flexneri]
MNQFKTTDQYLRERQQVNIAIGASVDQINNYAKTTLPAWTIKFAPDRRGGTGVT